MAAAVLASSLSRAPSQNIQRIRLSRLSFCHVHIPYDRQFKSFPTTRKKSQSTREHDCNLPVIRAEATSHGSRENEPFYAHPSLDRMGHRRNDAVWLRESFENAESMIVPVDNDKSLVNSGQAVFLTAAQASTVVSSKIGHRGPIFLGVQSETGKAAFAVDVSGAPRSFQEGKWVDLRREGPNLANKEAALLAYARGMVQWHSRTKFCPQCAAELAPRDAGHSLQCVSDTCRQSQYPRVDPAVIMMVTCGDYVLLGRQSRWARGRYSLLAGFVETGETLGQAVAREVMEESGIAIIPGSVKFCSSQPWPFPCSLMLGFTARAEPRSDFRPIESHTPSPLRDETGRRVFVGSSEREDVLLSAMSLPTPTADTNELQDARWVHKSYVRSVLLGEGDDAGRFQEGGSMSVPGRYAIARTLLADWVEGSSGDGNGKCDVVADVSIDSGVFKYVLLRISDGEGNSKLIVRGDRGRPFHYDIFQSAKGEGAQHGLLVVPLGGGRIEHTPEKQSIHVYGYSQAFGEAEHQISVAILRRWYPLYDVTYAFEGY